MLDQVNERFGIQPDRDLNIIAKGQLKRTAFSSYFWQETVGSMPRNHSVELKENAVQRIFEVVRLESCTQQGAYEKVRSKLRD
ncbi:hypothetical protein [Brevibacterium paucivorans]|uniref:Uncharacterized protein n=1 Tax=Brevibacterium paucivorans TaxID=170994 RepID=A0A2N6VLD0_9MICO|nr:hypothetical protein [Brevibacterium paucivorans]PMD04962.1 hypothetical protein CJ199_07635 [Brevibacterium paucivorans]